MNYNMIDEIPTKASRCILHVRVSRSWDAININYNTVLHRDLVLIDEKGDQIWAIIPERYMRVYADLLAHQKVYMVRNFKVKEAPKRFRPIDNRFALEFTPATVVEEIDTANNIPRYKFNFITANQIPDNLENRALLWDTVGYVLEYKKPNGARANSIGKQLRLQIEKINESKLAVTRPIYSDPSDLANSAEVTLEALNEAILDVQNKHKYFIVKCTIKCIKDGWRYTGCQLCSKKVEDGVPDYICCNILRTETAKRFRIQMEVADGTSEANLVVLDNLGQVLLGTTATSLFELSDSDSRNPPSVLTKMVDTAIEVQVQEKVSESVGGGNESSQQSFDSCVTEQQSSSLKATAASATSTTFCTVELPSVVTPTTPKEKIPAFGEGNESSILQSTTAAASSTTKKEINVVKFKQDLEQEILDDNVPLSTMKKDLKRKKLG
ncbi:hypothetical protein LINGRAHAP2_LOCUS1514 [Linum grandiflorum]